MQRIQPINLGQIGTVKQKQQQKSGLSIMDVISGVGNIGGGGGMGGGGMISNAMGGSGGGGGGDNTGMIWKILKMFMR